MSLLTFSDRLQVLRARGYLPDLHNFIILHAAEFEALTRAAEVWYEAKRFSKAADTVEAAEKDLVRALDQLTEKRRKEPL